MTSQGTAHGRFTRAIRTRNLRAAEMAARELGALSVDDALRLCVLFAHSDPQRFERAALRWLERVIGEQASSLDQLGPIVAALTKLRDDGTEAAEATLRRLARG